MIVGTKVSRERLLRSAGKGLGLMALLSPTVSLLLDRVQRAADLVDGLDPLEAAKNVPYWKQIADAFSLDKRNLNLNSGWTSPSPRLVTEAYLRYRRQEDATAYTMWQMLEPQAETIRAGLADVFGCSPDEIAITRNASESLQILLFGIDLRRGDEVISTTQDYPRMLTALRQREMREGPVLRLVKIPLHPKEPSEIVDALESATTQRTRLILISHQINTTGQILPVREICAMAHSKGIEAVVDGAHSLGQFVFKRDDLQCDFFGSSLHKWMYAPKGAGLLYVKKEKIPSVWALMASDDKNRSDIRKFEEIGTHSSATRLSVGEALLFHEAIGPKRKEERLRYLTSYWRSRLANFDRISFNTPSEPSRFCAIGNFSIAGADPVEVSDHLMKTHRIITTPFVHEEFSGIRITPNIFTSVDHLDLFCDAVEDFLRTH